MLGLTQQLKFVNCSRRLSVFERSISAPLTELIETRVAQRIADAQPYPVTKLPE